MESKDTNSAISAGNIIYSNNNNISKEDTASKIDSIHSHCNGNSEGQIEVHSNAIAKHIFWYGWYVLCP